MLRLRYAQAEVQSQMAFGVSPECLGRGLGGPLVVIDYSRHDAARISQLQGISGIITTNKDPLDGRKVVYVLTQKGIDLAPVLTEMVLWAAGHEDTGNEALVQLIKKDKEQFLAGVRHRWSGKSNPDDR